MPTQKTPVKKPKAKTTATKGAKPKTTKAPVKKRASKTLPKEDSLPSLKGEIETLEKAYLQTQEDYGKLLEQYTNLRLKLNTMLGQILKALFIVGIGPDELTAKCGEMFCKKIVAD